MDSMTSWISAADRSLIPWGICIQPALPSNARTIVAMGLAIFT